MLAKRIGIDLGTANVLVWVKGEGIVINEPAGGALAASAGAHLPVGTASGNMIIDIGGGRSEAAVISMYGIVVMESVRVAGDAMDEAIATYVKRRHNLAIGERTAEEIKMAIGSAIPVESELAMEVRGRDQISGLPKSITMTTNEVTQELQGCLGT